MPVDWERHGDRFGFWSYNQPYRVTIDRFIDHDATLSAELVFTTLEGGDFYGPVRLNFMAPRSRQDLARQLASRDPKVPWGQLLDETFTICVREYRREAAPERVSPKALGAVPFLLGPLVPKSAPVVLHGDGGVGKSTLALAMALSIASNSPILPGTITTGAAAVGYLDWEDSEEIFRDRLARLMAGAAIQDQGPLYFARMRRPLADVADRLRAHVERLQLRLLVVDSFAYACGPEPDKADAAMRLFQALASLGDLASLVICHVAKAAMNGLAVRPPYGSVFVRNSARMTWEARTADLDDDSGMTIGLYNDKHNITRRMPPVGVRVVHTDDAITFRAAEVPASPSMLAHPSAAQVVLDFIRSQRLATNAEIAEGTGLPILTVNKTTIRFEKRKIIERLPQASKTAPTQWFYTGPPTPQPADSEEEDSTP